MTYKSTLPLNATNPFAGLKLLKESVKKDTNFIDGITICIRFNYRQLEGRDKTNSNFIFSHGHFVQAHARYQQTFFFFGSMNWLVKDVKKDSFLLWSTTRWHSLCISFDRATSHITFIKVNCKYRSNEKKMTEIVSHRMVTLQTLTS